MGDLSIVGMFRLILIPASRDSDSLNMTGGDCAVDLTIAS